jgi:nitrite reductase [NAD(P)H] small subunit
MTANKTEVTVGPISAVPPGEGRSFSAFGEKVSVFRTRTGQVYAVQAECPHRGGPLADGLIGGTTVICPLHSWKFDLTTGNALFGDCGLKTYPARIDEAGQIVVAFDSPDGL